MDLSEISSQVARSLPGIGHRRRGRVGALSAFPEMSKDNIDTSGNIHSSKDRKRGPDDYFYALSFLSIFYYRKVSSFF